MKRKLRGIKRRDIQFDFDLYRVSVPIAGVAGASLSVVDLVARWRGTDHHVRPRLCRLLWRPGSSRSTTSCAKTTA